MLKVCQTKNSTTSDLETEIDLITRHACGEIADSAFYQQSKLCSSPTQMARMRSATIISRGGKGVKSRSETPDHVKKVQDIQERTTKLIGTSSDTCLKTMQSKMMGMTDIEDMCSFIDTNIEDLIDENAKELRGSGTLMKKELRAAPVEHQREMVETYISLMDVVALLNQVVIKMISDVVIAVTDFLQKQFQKIKDTIVNVWNEVKKTINQIWNFFG